MDIRYVSGFLGSGKTTFLKAYLQNHPTRVGVIVNDFGDTSVDVLQLKSYASTIRDVSGGSMFCTCKMNTFIDTLAQMASHDLDEILVETSGFSNPGNILSLMQSVNGLKPLTYKGLITMVAANQFEKVVHTCVPARKQIERADVLFVTKMDAVDAPFEHVVQRVRAHNQSAPVYRVDHGQYQPEWLDVVTPSLAVGPSTMDVSLRRASLILSGTPSETQLRQFFKQIWVYVERIKGMINTVEGTAYIEYDDAGLKVHPPTDQPAIGVTLLGRNPVMNLGEIERICAAHDWVKIRS